MLHGNRIFVFFAPSKTKCVDKHKPFEADEMPSSGHRLVQKRRKPPRNRELSTRQIVANLTSIGGGAEGGRTPVRRPDDQSFSERSLCFDIPSAGLPQTGFRFQ